LIATTTELDKVLQEIDNTQISQSKKDSKKLSIIKTQVNVRKKVLGQQIKITYTHARRKRPICEILAEFHDSVAGFFLPDLVCNPLSFVGKEVDHKFQVDEGIMELF
jgi:hypothetical protein